MELHEENACIHPALPLLFQWLHLSEEETKSIKTSDWAEVSRIQNAKAVLQSQLSEQNADNNTNEISEIADTLIAIETNNRHLLDSRLIELKKRMDDDSKSLSNMNNVQNAYIHAPLNSRHSISRLELLT